MEIARLFFDAAVPILGTLFAVIWRSAAQRVDHLEQKVQSLEEDKCRLEVAVARLDAIQELSRP